jgi:hypothetical protein
MTDDPTHDTLMWEVVAAPGRLADLLAWIDDTAVTALRAMPDCEQVDAYSASDDRAVLIVRFAGRPARIPDPPEELLKRPAHQWPFSHRWSHSAHE